MWNEMLQLRELDYTSFIRKTSTFEHVVTSLFSLDEHLKESILSSMEISKCCAHYLLRISERFNFTPSMFSPDQKSETRMTKESLTKLDEINSSNYSLWNPKMEARRKDNSLTNKLIGS